MYMELNRKMHSSQQSSFYLSSRKNRTAKFLVSLPLQYAQIHQQNIVGVVGSEGGRWRNVSAVCDRDAKMNGVLHLFIV